MWLKLTNNYSPNFTPQKRSKIKINFIIIHYTGMKSENASIKRLCNEKKKVSTHYFIKNSGEILKMVPDLYEAWHAGKSKWKKISSLNKYSIGIEIQNPGHNYNYKSYSYNQIKSLKILLRVLIKKYNISLKNILGHSDIAPDRKKDPGEKFPWKKIAKSNLSIWHNLREKKLKKDRLKKLSKHEKKFFLINLNTIGYQKIKGSNSNEKNIIKAFQRRFRQCLINGISDKECYLISKNLLKS